VQVEPPDVDDDAGEAVAAGRKAGIPRAQKPIRALLSAPPLRRHPALSFSNFEKIRKW
jgi:hypothetical protein